MVDPSPVAQQLASQRKHSLLRHLALVLLAAYVVAFVLPMASPETRDFHDFASYYYAGKAYSAGLNPYDLGVLRSVSGGEVQFPFLYPPLTLQVFRLFALLPFEAACQLFLAAKIAALGGLLLIWTRTFLGGLDVAFLFFCLLAFNSPIYIDLSVGNVSMFEQLLIWVGLRQHLRGDVRGFALAILAAALFKLTPIVLLLLLLRRGGGKREWRWLVGCGAILAVSVLGSYLANPEFYTSFRENMQRVDFKGVVNPTSLTIFQFISDGFAKCHQWSLPPALPWALYGLVVLAVVAFSVRALRRLCAAADGPDPERAHRHAIALAVLAYALILPRLPDYGYIVVLLPAYYAVRAFRGSALPWLFVLMSLQAFNLRIPGAAIAYSILWAHMPLLMAFVAWGLLVHASGRLSEDAYAARVQSPST